MSSALRRIFSGSRIGTPSSSPPSSPASPVSSLLLVITAPKLGFATGGIENVNCPVEVLLENPVNDGVVESAPGSLNWKPLVLVVVGALKGLEDVGNEKVDVLGVVLAEVSNENELEVNPLLLLPFSLALLLMVVEVNLNALVSGLLGANDEVNDGAVVLDGGFVSVVVEGFVIGGKVIAGVIGALSTVFGVATEAVSTPYFSAIVV